MRAATRRPAFIGRLRHGVAHRDAERKAAMGRVTHIVAQRLFRASGRGFFDVDRSDVAAVVLADLRQQLAHGDRRITLIKAKSTYTFDGYEVFVLVEVRGLAPSLGAHGPWTLSAATPRQIEVAAKERAERERMRHA